MARTMVEQIEFEEKLTRIAERLDECNGTWKEPICRKCGKYLSNEQSVGEVGWYMRTTVYKCTCGHWGKTFC
jgi:lysyl-tRNA synthetase class I